MVNTSKNRVLLNQNVYSDTPFNSHQWLYYKKYLQYYMYYKGIPLYFGHLQHPVILQLLVCQV